VELKFVMNPKAKIYSPIRFMIRAQRKGEQAFGPEKSLQVQRHGSNLLEVMDVDIVRSISASPVEGVIRPNTKKACEVTVNLCVQMMVAYWQDIECELVIQLSWDKMASVHRLPVTCQLAPSMMRLPMELLASLKDKPLIEQTDESNYVTRAKVTSDNPMPKEIINVLFWIYELSMKAPPKTLEWWPESQQGAGAKSEDPREAARVAAQNQQEIGRVQKYIEAKKPLPIDNTELPVRAGMLFLLRWLTNLPDPIITDQSIYQFSSTGSVKYGLKALDDMPRNVLVYLATLLAQLKANHSYDFNQPLTKVSAALTAHTQAEDGKLFLGKLIAELGKSKEFPPSAKSISSLS